MELHLLQSKAEKDTREIINAILAKVAFDNTLSKNAIVEATSAKDAILRNRPVGDVKWTNNEYFYDYLSLLIFIKSNFLFL